MSPKHRDPKSLAHAGGLPKYRAAARETKYARQGKPPALAREFGTRKLNHPIKPKVSLPQRNTF